MKAKILPLLAASLILAACAVTDGYDDDDDYGRREHRHEHRHDSHRHGGRHDHSYGRTDSYNCENGLSVRVRQLGGDRIERALDDKRAILNAAVSGSGERYTAGSGLFGRGAEWHSKGNEAYFEFTDPYGNKVNTSCRLR